MSSSEDIDIEIKWKSVLESISKTFGEVEDLKDIIFLVGIQELGKGYKKLSKDEKIDVMHIGLCHLLEPYGYYEFIGRDEQGWPHWNNLENLPALSEAEKNALLKRAIIEYFEN